MTTLEQKIFDYIETIYKCTFIGRVSVEITGNLYEFRLTLGNYMAPIYMSFECSTEDDFLNRAYKEISERNLVKSKFYKIILFTDETNR